MTTETPNVLDFDENGQATIVIPQIQEDFSFILNYWKKPEKIIQEIDIDLLNPDTEQRKNFLEKFRKHLSESLDKYDFSEEQDESEEENLREEENYRCSKKTTHLENSNNNFYNSSYLTVYNYHLKHSFVWYLMNCIQNEIVELEKEIEVSQGLFIVLEKIDKYICIIRDSDNSIDAINKISKEFQLSKLQAERALELNLHQLSNLGKSKLTTDIEKYKFIISLLKNTQ